MDLLFKTNMASIAIFKNFCAGRLKNMLQENLQLADWSSVPDIIKILETDFPDSLPACRYLEFYSSWKKKEPNLKAVLLTPGGKVNKWGTFVLYVEGQYYNMFHSLNSNCKEMKSLLMARGIPWDKKPIWGPIHEKLQPVLDELYEEGNMKPFFTRFIGSAYLMGVSEAKKITYTCPPEVYLSPIKEEHADLIDSHWSVKNDKSADFTKFIIRKNGGLGVYLKESNELIAWCLIWTHNGPGQLFVLNQYKRKGYGMLLAQAITKLVAEKGVQPLCYIRDANKACLELSGRIGYRQFCRVTWSGAQPFRVKRELDSKI